MFVHAHTHTHTHEKTSFNRERERERHVYDNRGGSTLLNIHTTNMEEKFSIFVFLSIKFFFRLNSTFPSFPSREIKQRSLALTFNRISSSLSLSSHLLSEIRQSNFENRYFQVSLELKRIYYLSLPIRSGKFRDTTMIFSNKIFHRSFDERKKSKGRR